MCQRSNSSTQPEVPAVEVESRPGKNCPECTTPMNQVSQAFVEPRLGTGCSHDPWWLCPRCNYHEPM